MMEHIKIQKQCSTCHYTDNNLGIVAYHCTCKKKEAKENDMDGFGKVRSYHTCKHWKERK